MQQLDHPISAEELMAYLDGELPFSKAAEARRHVEQCRECQALAAELQRISGSLASWQVDTTDVPVPEELSKILNSSLPEHRAQRRGFLAITRVRPWMLAVAAAAIILLVALPLRERVPSPTTPEPQGLALERKQADETFVRSNSNNIRTFGGLASRTAPSGVVGGSITQDGALAAQNSKLPARHGIEGSLIVRTAELTLTARDFDSIRESITRLLATRQGYIAQLQMTTPLNEARTLTATLRVPASELDALLGDLKRLGRVDSESQRGEEVTEQVIDLEARIANLRVTETRLIEILRERTGRLADVLQLEEQIDQTRGQIERAVAEQKHLRDRIAFATVELRVNDLYKASLQIDHPSLSARIRNAGVEGIQTLAHGLIGVLIWMLSNGPSLVVLAAVLFWPARFIWRRMRAAG